MGTTCILNLAGNRSNDDVDIGTVDADSDDDDDMHGCCICFRWIRSFIVLVSFDEEYLLSSISSVIVVFRIDENIHVVGM